MKKLSLLKGLYALAFTALLGLSPSETSAQAKAKTTSSAKAKTTTASAGKKAPAKATSKPSVTVNSAASIKKVPALAVATPAKTSSATEPATPVAPVAAAPAKITRKPSAVFQGGSNVLGFGVGLVNNLDYPKEGNTVIPLTFSYERGLNVAAGPGVIGVGGSISYFQHSWGEDYKYSVLYFAAKGAYHYDLAKNDKLDTYAGLTLGYAREKVKWDSSYGDVDSSDGEVKAGLLVGARYFFTESMGAHLELETGPMSHITIGVNYKF